MKNEILERYNRVCICGGGSLGHVVSAVLSTKGCKVSLLTTKPYKWSKTLEVTDFNMNKYTAHFDCISANPKDVISKCDIVLVCLPGFAIEPTLKQIQPYITTQAVGSIVCSSGFFLYAHDIFPKQQKLYGFQRVPYIARTEEYGKSAHILGDKNKLFITTENIIDNDFIDFWQLVFNKPIERLGSYLQATLTNSNPLLHPSRLYSLWHDWHEGIYYNQCPRFYSDWDDYTSQLYIACDNELHLLTNKYNVELPTVLEYYESYDASSLTRKLRSIESFKNLNAPMICTEKGYVPDFNNRYFTEDIPFGMQHIQNLARKENIPTPTIDKILQWGYKVLNKN